jgi:hypothetical protein
MSRLVLTFKDFSREKSTLELLMPEVTAGGADYDALLVSMQDVITALEAVSVGVISKESLSIVEATEVGDAPAGSKRELGLRVFWADTTAETVGHFTIPCPDPTGAWLVVGTDEVDVTDTDIDALIDELETNVYSPDGNLIAVSKIVEVGRRN